MRSIFYATLLFVICAHGVSGEVNGNTASALTQAKAAMGTDLDRAEALIEKALADTPNDADVQFTCGRIMGKQAENAIFSALSYAKKSLRCLQRAVTLQPHNTDYRKALMHFYLGVPGIAGGDKALAWQQVEQIATIDSLQGVKAELSYYRETEQSSQYEQLLATSRDTYPDHAEFHYRYGLVLQQKQQYGEAMDMFEHAINAPEDDDNTFVMNAYYQIGRTAVFSEQQVDNGIKALNHYLTQTLDSRRLPEKHWAHFRLAQLHDLAGNESMKKQHFTLASESNDKALQRELRKRNH
ncbi:hypothetical protein DRW07_02760 [Alteromonas sediminis]|uniref:Uncharacterized protein n=1 Tax=Alteromonas sediminis TaxID=2259342 RepID=A0A3N5ZDR9_9ALTE|nr:hypothetical protein [Alteromonas sediminis]RPJ68348.1 hypothetical protein DRW07_02760 [Alteromonas sediminis]